MSVLTNCEDINFSQMLIEKIEKPNGDTISKHYQKGQLLGQGGFAKVFKLTCVETNQILAGKIIPKSLLGKSRARQKLMSEIKIHRSLHHTNIVKFCHFFEDENFLYILLELCQNQTLGDLMRRRKRITELETQCFLLQVISGLKHMHYHRVIHRDIKLGNVFIDENMEIKIGDFGLAAKLEYEGERKRTVCGTPNYMAPEIIDGKFGHSYECDIWSFGVLMYTLLVGRPPFDTNDVKSTYRRIKLNLYTFPENMAISEDAKSLIASILVIDYTKRPTFDQILDHNFFTRNIIPKVLPLSILAVPPTQVYIKQFEARGRNRQRSLIKSTSQQHTPTSDTPSPTNERPHSRGPQTVFYSENKGLIISTGYVLPQPNGPEIWVKAWIETAKYGLAYILSNNWIGMLFNDKTKIISSPNGKIVQYISTSKEQEKIKQFTMTEFPEELYKKVKLLQIHKNKLACKEEQCSKTFENGRVDYVKNWLKATHAMVFRLNNKIIQVWFHDKSELLFASQSKNVTYVSKNGTISSNALTNALEEGSHDMVKRLKYSKEVLMKMLKGKERV